MYGLPAIIRLLI